jgi:epoxyqueuosine reductase QueG
VESLTQPFQWIENVLKDLVSRASENRLTDFDRISVFDLPVIGVADGDNPLFESFRGIVSPNHILPREILGRHASKEADLASVSVISWALPFSEPIRLSNREGSWPSRLYSLARNNGGALIYQLSLRLIELCREKEIAAVAPSVTSEYDAFRIPDLKFSSTWSERHVAFAAGLGRFGLNGSLLTPLGSNVRLGSIITNLRLEPAKVDNRNYRAPCFASEGKDCAACLERCPVGALSGAGLNKFKCNAMRNAVRRRHLAQYSQEMNMLLSPVVKSSERNEGYSLGCALCQCGVPCEGLDPFGERIE